MRLRGVEAFLNPDGFVDDRSSLGIGRLELLGFLDGGCGICTRSQDMIPEGVQSFLCQTGITAYEDAVTSGIPFGMFSVKARSRVEGPCQAI